jgi:hypothetical protein
MSFIPVKNVCGVGPVPRHQGLGVVGPAGRRGGAVGRIIIHLVLWQLWSGSLDCNIHEKQHLSFEV